jgi:Spy/CpxP family protein refolding chaperone
MFLFLAVSASAADPAPVEGRATERLDAALDRVEATPQQRDQAHARLDDALGEARALRERALDVRERVHDALFGAAVDRKALERARTDLMAVVDDGTSLFFDAAADLAELFTAEQRAELHQFRHDTIRERMIRWWREE